MARNVERQCALKREVRPASELLRFVKAPDGTLTFDTREKLPGRGVWITATRVCLEEAAKKNVFARSLKEKTAVPEDLADQVGRILHEDALNSLSLARKAGVLVLGHHKCAEALERGQVTAVVEATDGAEDSLRKLRNAANRAKSNSVGLFRVFTAREMSQATGQINSVHAALLDKPGAQVFIRTVSRLLHYHDMPCETL